VLQKTSYGSAEVVSLDKEKLLDELRSIASRLMIMDKKIEEVLLFGSIVRGDYTPDSDIDILIIQRDISQPFLKRADRFRDNFIHLPLDTDIKVYTRAEIEEMRKAENPFIEEALRTSVILAPCRTEVLVGW
jgi:predicted nucleotidyltransferase